MFWSQPDLLPVPTSCVCKPCGRFQRSKASTLTWPVYADPRAATPSVVIKSINPVEENVSRSSLRGSAHALSRSVTSTLPVLHQPQYWFRMFELGLTDRLLKLIAVIKHGCLALILINLPAAASNLGHGKLLCFFSSAASTAQDTHTPCLELE